MVAWVLPGVLPGVTWRYLECYLVLLLPGRYLQWVVILECFFFVVPKHPSVMKWIGKGHLVTIDYDALNGNKPRLRLSHVPWKNFRGLSQGIKCRELEMCPTQNSWYTHQGMPFAANA